MRAQLSVTALAVLMILGYLPALVPADTVIDNVSIATSDSNADGKPDTASVTVLVDNHNAAAPPTTITVKAKLFPPGKAADPASADFISTDQKTVNNPAPMALSSFVLNLAATANSGIGSYTVLIEESNDDDQGSNYVTTTRSVMLYQLNQNATFILSVDQDEHLFGPGQNATFNFTLWNKGASPDNYTIIIPLYNAPWQVTADKTALAVNDGANGTFAVTVLGPLLYWGYQIYTDILIQARSDSSSELQNLSIRLTAGFPDLQIYPSDVTISNSNPNVGDAVAFHARVRNNGTVAASNVLVNFSMYFAVLSTVSIPYIAAGGASAVVNYTWTATPGASHIGISADPGSNVAELVATNNAVTVEVIVRSAELVSYTTDLATSPANLTVGMAANLSLTIHNVGGSNATAFTVRITIDTFTQDKNVAGIPANGSAVVNFTYTVDQGVDTVYVHLDSADTVGEQNEFDNNVTFELHYNLPPFANITKPIGGIYMRDTVTFSAHGSYDNDGRIVNYHFDFGDHNFKDTVYPYADHYYTGPGEYLVTLVVTDDSGAVSATASVVVNIMDRTAVAPGFIPGFELVAVLGAAGAVSVLAGRKKQN
jgi:hypothetical protein